MPYKDPVEKRRKERERYYANKEARLEQVATYRAANRALINEKAKARYWAQRSRLLEVMRAYAARSKLKRRLAYKANPASLIAAAARRRAAKFRATPLWADQGLTLDLYSLAAIYRAAGIAAHVDHIVPLQSEKVCGLHCPDNLTVLPAKLNLQKKNHHWPDMPE